MRIPNALAKVAHVILMVAIPFLLLVTPLYLIASPAYMRHEYGLPNFPSSQRFSDAERLRLSTTIVKYVMGRATEEEMATLRTDAGEIALRDEEVQHLVDVRVVMDGFRLAHAALLALAAAQCGSCVVLGAARPVAPTICGRACGSRRG